MDNSFQEPVWATVEKHVADEEQAGQGLVYSVKKAGAFLNN